MELLNRYWNAYRYVYMGDSYYKILGQEITYGKKFIVMKRLHSWVSYHIPEEDRDNFICSKIIYTGYTDGGLIYDIKRKRTF